MSAQYVGKRLDADFSQFPSPTVVLQPYVKLDLAASVRVARGRASSVSLTARIENALDRHFEDVFNFPAPRRAVLIGARISASR